MNYLSTQVDLSIDFLKSPFRKLCIAMGIFFLVVMIVSFVFVSNNPDTLTSIINSIMTTFEKSGLLSFEGTALAVGLFCNNAKACALLILFGVMPFLFLPLLSGASNAAIISAVLYYGSDGQWGVIAKMFAFGILPHGLFELPALILSLSCGIYLCKILTSAFFRYDMNIISAFQNVSRVYIFMIIPMLVIASIIETFITPITLSLM